MRKPNKRFDFWSTPDLKILEKKFHSGKDILVISRIEGFYHREVVRELQRRDITKDIDGRKKRPNWDFQDNRYNSVR